MFWDKATFTDSGIENYENLNIRFRIRSGDSDNFFKAEAEKIGDFVFLLIRTKTNNMDVLNRERRDSYELEIRTRVRDKGHFLPEDCVWSKIPNNLTKTGLYSFDAEIMFKV